MYICIVNKIYYLFFIMAATSEKEIYLAGGCFWGTEHYFKQIEGVVETEVGYANGIIENPTYEQVCTDQTRFAETVRVRYNPEVVSLEFLLHLYFKAIDPVSVNQQGHDKGTQYRTGVYYTDPTTSPSSSAYTRKSRLPMRRHLPSRNNRLRISLLPRNTTRTISTRIPRAIATCPSRSSSLQGKQRKENNNNNK